MKLDVYSKEVRQNPSKYGIFYERLYNRHKEVKQKLVDDYGKCVWCKTPVVIYPHKLYAKGEKAPPDLATLDHLKSKNTGRKVGENTPKVLACSKCNEQRAQREILYKRIRELNQLKQSTR